MKIYILYLITALIVFWMILFLYGISAGFASYAPILALLGSVVLFIIATPAFIYNVRIGLIIGLIGCLLIIPFMLLILKGLYEDGVFNLGILIGMTPVSIILLSTYFTVKKLFFDSVTESNISPNAGVKFLLAGIPVVLFGIYILLYGEYWRWEMLYCC